MKATARPIAISLVLLSRLLAGCDGVLLPAATPSQPPVAAQTAAPPPSSTPQPLTVAPPSPAATAAPTIATATPTAAAVSPAGEGAVQALLDYWGAITRHDFATAYSMWAGDGAASGQGYEQFARGLQHTGDQARLLIGTLWQPGGAAGAVTAPATLALVIYDPGGSGRLQRYQGNYTLAPQDGAWRITAADLVEVPDTEPPVDVREPVALLQAYFDAINRRQYARAYTYFAQSGRASGQTYAEFVHSMATIDLVEFQYGRPYIHAGGAQGFSDYPVLVVAVQRDGTVNTYCGSYSIVHWNMPPYDQFGCLIAGATLSPVAPVRLGSAAAERLLSSGCAP